MVIFQIKIFHEINFFLIIIYILLQFKTVYWFSPENSMDNWHSECIAICQWTTIMHCNWPQFNWVKEGNNTAGGQWSITLCFDEVFTSQHVTSVYCNLKSSEEDFCRNEGPLKPYCTTSLKWCPFPSRTQMDVKCVMNLVNPTDLYTWS